MFLLGFMHLMGYVLHGEIRGDKGATFFSQHFGDKTCFGHRTSEKTKHKEIKFIN